MSVAEIVMVPAGPGRYRALLGSMAITKPTRSPLFDGARALLALHLGYRNQGRRPWETVERFVRQGG